MILREMKKNSFIRRLPAVFNPTAVRRALFLCSWHLLQFRRAQSKADFKPPAAMQEPWLGRLATSTIVVGPDQGDDITLNCPACRNRHWMDWRCTTCRWYWSPPTTNPETPKQLHQPKRSQKRRRNRTRGPLVRIRALPSRRVQAEQQKTLQRSSDKSARQSALGRQPCKTRSDVEPLVTRRRPRKRRSRRGGASSERWDETRFTHRVRPRGPGTHPCFHLTSGKSTLLSEELTSAHWSHSTRNPCTQLQVFTFNTPVLRERADRHESIFLSSLPSVFRVFPLMTLLHRSTRTTVSLLEAGLDVVPFGSSSSRLCIVCRHLPMVSMISFTYCCSLSSWSAFPWATW